MTDTQPEPEQLTIPKAVVLNPEAIGDPEQTPIVELDAGLADLIAPRAVARATDPSTSWEAAHSLTADTIRKSQRQVLNTIRGNGRMTDATLVEWLEQYQSPSGIRTRRKELVDMGLVVDTGDRETLPSGRNAIVWGIAP